MEQKAGAWTVETYAESQVLSALKHVILHLRPPSQNIPQEGLQQSANGVLHHCKNPGHHISDMLILLCYTISCHGILNTSPKELILPLNGAG